MHRGKCVVPIRVVVLLVVDEKMWVISKISRNFPKIEIFEISEISETIFLENIFSIKTWIPELVGVFLEC